MRWRAKAWLRVSEVSRGVIQKFWVCSRVNGDFIIFNELHRLVSPTRLHRGWLIEAV